MYGHSKCFKIAICPLGCFHGIALKLSSILLLHGLEPYHLASLTDYIGSLYPYLHCCPLPALYPKCLINSLRGKWHISFIPTDPPFDISTWVLMVIVHTAVLVHWALALNMKHLYLSICMNRTILYTVITLSQGCLWSLCNDDTCTWYFTMNCWFHLLRLNNDYFDLNSNCCTFISYSSPVLPRV